MSVANAQNMLCVIAPKLPQLSVKNEMFRFSLGGAGSVNQFGLVLYLAVFIIPCHIAYKQLLDDNGADVTIMAHPSRLRSESSVTLAGTCGNANPSRSFLAARYSFAIDICSFV